jgi:hypothetical protein
MSSSESKQSIGFKSYKDPTLILDYKNFESTFERLKEVLILEYDLAGRILSLGKECPPTLPMRTRINFVDPGNPTAEELFDQQEQEEVRRVQIQLVAKDTNRYESQKIQISTRLLMQCSQLLRLEVEKDSTFDRVSNDPLRLSRLIEETVYLGGERFGFRDHVKQIMILARNNMHEKANLNQFTKKFSSEFDRLLTMLAKLKLDDKSAPEMTIEQYVTKLIAAFYIEALPKNFDEVRKDISNEKMTSVVQPNTLQEAIRLADQYDNVKSTSMLASNQYKSPPDNIAAPSATNSKKQSSHGKGIDHSENKSTKKNCSIYTDPQKPPPEPWPKMAYCTYCKRWCSHIIDNCKNKTKDNASEPEKKKHSKKPSAKLGAATVYEDGSASMWGMPVK